MFRINNNDFKILIKYKTFLNKLDDILENIPRKDKYYKDKLREVSLNLLANIISVSYKSNVNDSYIEIKTQISVIDFMLERLFSKKYISEKALYNIGTSLVEINKMTIGMINNIRKNES